MARSVCAAIAATAVAATAIVFLFLTSADPASSPVRAAQSSSNAATVISAAVENGRYKSIVAGCQACHSAPDGTPWVGGATLQTPFGKLAVPNITPGRETGIGNWTLAEFSDALRKGTRADGQPLYPAMPYLHYTKMTDQDVAAIWAYLRSLKPVRNKVEVNRLPFPFNVRESVAAWQRLYFDEGRFKPDPSRSDQWNRGAYIVEAMAHCGSCHTPRDPLGGPIKSRRFKGANIENWYAPDISNAPGSVIAGWSKERLKAFLQGKDGRNHVAVGSMKQVVEDMGRMNDADVEAVSVYLKSLNSGFQAQTDDRITSAGEGNTAYGKYIYNEYCSSCHQKDGKGVPGIAASLVGSGAVIAQKADNVTSILLQGVGPRGKFGGMPSFRDVLSNDEIAAVTNYIRTAWGNNAPATTRPWDVASKRRNAKTSKGAEAATPCLNVAASAVSPSVRKLLAGLAAKPDIEDAVLENVIESYRTDHPDADATRRVADLGGTYCNEVAKTGADRQTVLRREQDFFARLLSRTGKTRAN